MTKWYHFWNPWSGPRGGFIFMALAYLVAKFFYWLFYGPTP